MNRLLQFWTWLWGLRLHGMRVREIETHGCMGDVRGKTREGIVRDVALRPIYGSYKPFKMYFVEYEDTHEKHWRVAFAYRKDREWSPDGVLTQRC